MFYHPNRERKITKESKMLARKQAENMATKEREKEELVELTSGVTG